MYKPTKTIRAYRIHELHAAVGAEHSGLGVAEGAAAAAGGVLLGVPVALGTNAHAETANVFSLGHDLGAELGAVPLTHIAPDQLARIVSGIRLATNGLCELVAVPVEPPDRPPDTPGLPRPHHAELGLVGPEQWNVPAIDEALRDFRPGQFFLRRRRRRALQTVAILFAY